MTRSFIYKAMAAGSAMALLSGCAAIGLGGEADARWADYKNWTQVSEPTTGASPGLGAVHKGPEGYRVVFVNDIGKDTILGDGPYEYPEGTVVVKEQYDNEAAAISGTDAEVTVSLKVASGAGADTWNWATSYTATAGESAFCSGCHSIPFAKDFVFSNSEYLAANE
jgi:hypothetical protein